jgi:tetratricopeptide (TPR) repeat protein
VEAIQIAVANDPRIFQQVVDRANREYSEYDSEGVVRGKATQAARQLQATAAQTLKALYALVSGLGRVPGRKTVILMTEGFMFEEAGGALRQIVAQAARSDVRIYTLDALGLRRGDTGTDLSQMNPLETGGQIPTGAYNTVEEGPNTLAVDTGGYVIRKTNDYTGALAEISRDTSSYYVIGYSPANAKMDGTFRQISVRVKRPGVEVRARKGYLAVPVAAAGTGATPAAPPAAPPIAAPSAPLPSAATPAVDPANVPAGLATSPLVMRPDTATRVRNLETMSPGAGAVKDAASQGWEHYRKGDLEGAEQSLDQAAAQAGAAPWVHYALGFAKLGLKKPQEAAVSWERVRASAPQFTEVYLDLADAYIMLDDPGRAVTVLRDAEHRWPANADVLNALGTVQVRRGALNDAIDTFRDAIERQPKDSLAYFNLARTHELRYYQMRRFSRPGARWIDNPEELKKAGEYYEAYVKMGGPYVDEARAGLQRVRFK